MAQIAEVSEADLAYYNGAAKKSTTQSSVLISSSPYLNHPELRALIAQEMLRRNGADLPRVETQSEPESHSGSEAYG